MKRNGAADPGSCKHRLRDGSRTSGAPLPLAALHSGTLLALNVIRWHDGVPIVAEHVLLLGGYLFDTEAGARAARVFPHHDAGQWRQRVLLVPEINFTNLKWAVSSAEGNTNRRIIASARFTSLFHHLSAELLRLAFFALKRDAAPGVDGLTWQDYEADLDRKIEDLHARVHSGKEESWTATANKTRARRDCS
jgi:hypothetical protein